MQRGRRFRGHFSGLIFARFYWLDRRDFAGGRERSRVGPGANIPLSSSNCAVSDHLVFRMMEVVCRSGAFFTLVVTVFVSATLHWSQLGTEATALCSTTGCCAIVRGHPDGDVIVTKQGCDPNPINVRVCHGFCSSNATPIFPYGVQETHHSCSVCLPTHFVKELVWMKCGQDSKTTGFQFVDVPAGCQCQTPCGYDPCV